MASSNFIHYMIKSSLHFKTLTGVCLLCLMLWSSTAIATQTAKEEILDREAGILDRPWKINLVRLATRDYLRHKAQIKTGLPSYDQLVEGSRMAPQVLYDKLTAIPATTTPPPAQPVSVSNPAPEPAPEPPPIVSPPTTPTPPPPTTPTPPGPSVIPTS